MVVVSRPFRKASRAVALAFQNRLARSLPGLPRFDRSACVVPRGSPATSSHFRQPHTPNRAQSAFGVISGVTAGVGLMSGASRSARP